MEHPHPDWSAVASLVEEIVAGQKTRLLEMGRRVVPTLTPEDMLQPNDYPELENHPEFRYEEGVLSGLMTVQMALQGMANCARESS